MEPSRVPTYFTSSIGRPIGGKDLSETQQIRRSTDLIIGIIVVIFNIVEVILIARIKDRKKKNYEIVLLSLCVADFLFGFSNAAICVTFLAGRGQFSTLTIFNTTYFYFVLTSILHLSFIAIDRVVSVVKPIRHKLFMTRKKLYAVLAIIWIASTLSAVTLYVTNETTNSFMKVNIDQISNHHTSNIQQSNNTTRNNITRGMELVTENSQISTILSKIIRQKSIVEQQNRPEDVQNRKENRTGRFRVNLTNGSQIIARNNKPTRRRFRLPFIHTKANNYRIVIQNLLSSIILGADLLLVFLYSFIIYRVHQRQQNSQIREQNEQVSFVCVLVAGVFVTFTLPYAVKTLMTGRAGYYVNILLVSNSALNCIVYFFRGYCENRQVEKNAKHISSNQRETPIMMTPLMNRANTDHQ